MPQILITHTLPCNGSATPLHTSPQTKHSKASILTLNLIPTNQHYKSANKQFYHFFYKTLLYKVLQTEITVK